MQFKRTFGQTLTAVAWSFVGLRRRSDFERDVGAFNPFYVIAGAVLGVAIFIGTLLMVVGLVVR
jgi:hypothetical protein